MRRVLKIAARGLIAVVVLVFVAAILVYNRSEAKLHRKFSFTAPAPARLPPSAQSIERGGHVALSRGCLACHGKDLGGDLVMNDPAMGRVAGPNLTRGQGGLKEFSDDDFERAIRHGIAPDGHGLYLMPAADYSRLTEADMGDLVAYIRSVPPVDRDDIPIRVGPVARVLLAAGKIRLAAEIIDHDHVKPDVVEVGPTADYGRYLAVSCTGCHRDNFSGGRISAGPPSWPPAANLTPHPSGHLAQWTEKDFFTALRTHRRPDGTQIDPVMPDAFAQLTDMELHALWAFLKTLPSVPTGTR